MTDPQPFPGRYADNEERLWALIDLLRRIPGRIEFEGVALNGDIINTLENIACELHDHKSCPKPEYPKHVYAEPTHGKAFLRRNFG